MKSKLIKLPLELSVGDEIKINYSTYTVIDSWTASCSERIHYEIKRNKKGKVRTTQTEYMEIYFVQPLKERQLIILENNKDKREHYVVSSIEKRKGKLFLICLEVLM